MKRVVFDTTVLLDVLGNDQEKRHLASHLFEAANDGRLDVRVSAESIQELFTVLVRRSGSRDRAHRTTLRFVDALIVEAITEPIWQRAVRLMGEKQRIHGRDAFILATALEVGADAVVTRDQGLGSDAGSLWVDSGDQPKVNAFLLSQ